jgi:hypothetical protein
LYEFNYNRRPEVKEKNRLRMRIKWWTDPEYRARQLQRMREFVRIRPTVVPIQEPYYGHRWLEMAREIVLGGRDLDPQSPYIDEKYDDMGEVLLAIMEGRDPKQALKEYRSKEYNARFLDLHMGDFRDREDGSSWFDQVLPPTPSAEEEAIKRNPDWNSNFDWNSRGYRFDQVSTKRKRLRHKTQQPSRRRQKDAGWRKYA